MIFLDPAHESLEEVFSLGIYYPYRLPGGVRNPAFNGWSGMILDIKEAKRYGIDFFYKQLDPLLAKKIAIVTVPSSDVEKTTSGIRLLAQRLADNGRVDATGCLVRHQSISKLATGGSREKGVHLHSIRVEHHDLIRDRDVLLLDDILTTGGSIRACRELLLQAGVQRVKCAVLGKTFGAQNDTVFD